MPSTLAICKALAILCSGLFACAALYVSFVEHPARMLCGTRLAVTQFAPSYKRATVMQASLAALGTLAAIAAWLQGAPAPWLVGGLLLGAVIPFTLIVILPTNKRLLDPSLDKDSQQAQQLLQRWAMLHAVRSALSLASLSRGSGAFQAPRHTRTCETGFSPGPGLAAISVANSSFFRLKNLTPDKRLRRLSP